MGVAAIYLLETGDVLDQILDVARLLDIDFIARLTPRKTRTVPLLTGSATEGVLRKRSPLTCCVALLTFIPPHLVAVFPCFSVQDAFQCVRARLTRLQG